MPTNLSQTLQSASSKTSYPLPSVTLNQAGPSLDISSGLNPLILFPYRHRVTPFNQTTFSFSSSPQLANSAPSTPILGDKPNFSRKNKIDLGEITPTMASTPRSFTALNNSSMDSASNENYNSSTSKSMLTQNTYRDPSRFTSSKLHKAQKNSSSSIIGPKPSSLNRNSLLNSLQESNENNFPIQLANSHPSASDAAIPQVNQESNKVTKNAPRRKAPVSNAATPPSVRGNTVAGRFGKEETHLLNSNSADVVSETIGMNNVGLKFNNLVATESKIENPAHVDNMATRSSSRSFRAINAYSESQIYNAARSSETPQVLISMPILSTPTNPPSRYSLNVTSANLPLMSNAGEMARMGSTEGTNGPAIVDSSRFPYIYKNNSGPIINKGESDGVLGSPPGVATSYMKRSPRKANDVANDVTHIPGTNEMPLKGAAQSATSLRTVDADNVAYFFVKRYYSCLNLGSKPLSELYHENASLLWVFTDEAEEGEAKSEKMLEEGVKKAVGKAAIQQKLASLVLEGSVTTVLSVNALSIHAESFLIVVKGKICFNGTSGRYFVQSFVLTAEALDWYFIRNDILCLLESGSIGSIEQDERNAPSSAKSSVSVIDGKQNFSRISHENDTGHEDKGNGMKHGKNWAIEGTSDLSKRLPYASDTAAIDGTNRYQADAKAEGARILQLLHSSRLPTDVQNSMTSTPYNKAVAKKLVETLPDAIENGNRLIEKNRPSTTAEGGYSKFKADSRSNVDGEALPQQTSANAVSINKNVVPYEDVVTKRRSFTPVTSKGMVPSSAAGFREGTKAKESFLKSRTLFVHYIPQCVDDKAIESSVKDSILLADPNSKGHMVSIQRAKHAKKRYGFIVLDSEQTSETLLHSPIIVQGVKLAVERSVVKPRHKLSNEAGMRKFAEKNQKVSRATQ